MDKVKKISAYLIFIAILVYYISKVDFDFSILLDVSSFDVVSLLLLAFCGLLFGALFFYDGLKMFGFKKSPFFFINYISASYLLNYLPFKANLVFQGGYLYKKFAVSVKKYGFLVFLNYFFMFTASIVSVLFVYITYGLPKGIDFARFDSNIIFIIIGVVLLLTSIGIYLKFEKIKEYVKNFSENRNNLMKHLGSTVKLQGYVFIHIIIFALRLYICFSAVGQELTYYDALLIGVVANFSFLFSFTPGGIGIKEGMLGVLSYIMFGSHEIGVAASLLDRTLNLLFTIITGSLSLKYLMNIKEETP